MTTYSDDSDEILVVSKKYEVNKYKRIVGALSIVSVLLAGTVITLSSFLHASSSSSLSSSVTAKSNWPTTDFETKNAFSKNADVCTTEDCQNADQLIFKTMNTSVDPCEDFYRFSCGGFLDNEDEQIPTGSSSLNLLSNVNRKLSGIVTNLIENLPEEQLETNALKNAKKFYDSCTNVDLIETTGELEMKEALREVVGGWPIIDKSFSIKPDANDTQNWLIKHVSFAQLPFMASASLSIKNSKILVPVMAQPRSGTARLSFYEDKDRVDEYKKEIKNFIQNLKDDDDTVFIQDFFLDYQIDGIVKIEERIARMKLTALESAQAGTSIVQVGKLSSTLSGNSSSSFDYTSLLRAYFASENVELKDDEEVQVDELKFFAGMTSLLNDVNRFESVKKNFFNWLGWRFVRDSAEALPQKYRDILGRVKRMTQTPEEKEKEEKEDEKWRGAMESSTKNRNSSVEQQLRSIRCVRRVIGNMPMVVGRIYVKDYFSDASKQNVLEMVGNLRLVFKNILRAADWMDDTSKAKALIKADAMSVNIGYPDWILNNTRLDAEHDYVLDSERYLHNQVSIVRANIKDSIGTLREGYNEDEWALGPATVNAAFVPVLNQIIFPAGILQSPIYDANVPQYLNYGGIGTIIGHEITHGFDSQGRNYDENGVFSAQGFWNAETSENFKKRSQCLIDQADDFLIEQVNRKVNGQLTLGENTADNGGLKESFRAYQRWVGKNGIEPSLPSFTNYTPNQMFFIKYGQLWCAKQTNYYLQQQMRTDPHAPSEFRITGPTRNSYLFSETFDCKPKQANNPDKKCNVW
jgi:predicted metalloendopeptidase